MKTFLLPLCAFWLTGLPSWSAEQVLKQFQPADFGPAVHAAIGIRVTMGEDEKGVPMLLIENPEGKSQSVFLMEIDRPPVTSPLYAVTGEVRYERVVGPAYLEMWSHLGTGAYFTRTLGLEGPMASLNGTSEWRPFSLPFDATGAPDEFGQANPSRTGVALQKLQINLQMAGRGHVELRNLRLIQREWPITSSTHQPWWSDRAAGWVGGLGGAAIGLFASLAEWMAARGRGRPVVLAIAWALIASGVVALALGLIAVGARQPYGVYYPLLLMGLLCATIFSSRLRRFQQSYRVMELRRISSMDATA